MARLNREDTDKVCILRIQGPLSIQDSAALREHLMEAFSVRKGVILDLEKAETMDVACAQVLCSAHETFRKAGQDICTTGALPCGIRDSLRSMALTPESCDREPHGTCLWVSGGNHE